MLYILKDFFCCLPVYCMEPVINICCPLVVVFHIVGVLPDINIENWGQAAGEGRVLVCRGDDSQAASIQYELGITGTEYREGRLFETIFEVFGGAELAGHLLKKLRGFA